MNYLQSLRFLDTFLDLEKLSRFPSNSFFNLRRMEHLLRISGHPEKKFFPVLVAGTTGKGSTGFFLESILKSNGIPVGYYHSPHVEDPRERIRLGGVWISKNDWASGLSEIQALLIQKPLPHKLGVLTYFEMLTFLAIFVFSRKGVRVGIFEIGLGGRLDATNVLKAPVVILTPIHLDHEAFLGDTIRKITREKAGIIKPHTHVVTGWQTKEAMRVIRDTVRKNQGMLWRSEPVKDIPLGLPGDFQRKNAGTALQAARLLQMHFNFPLSEREIRKGLKLSNWRGRLESFYQGDRTITLDGAHNPISVAQLLKEIKKKKNQGNDWLIFGAMTDKKSRKMLEILSRFFSRIILVPIASNRAKTLGMLTEEAKGLFKCALAAQNTGEALRLFQAASDPGDRALVTGSFYLVSEARKLCQK